MIKDKYSSWDGTPGAETELNYLVTVLCEESGVAFLVYT